MDESVERVVYLLFLNPEGFSLGNLINLIVLILLLACSALISASEVAYFSLAPAKIRELEESKNKKDHEILSLVERSRRLLATILISNNFINVAIILLSTLISESLFVFHDIVFQSQKFDFVFSFSAKAQEFSVNVILITFMILMAGEVIPKVYAAKSPLFLARIMAKPLLVLRSIFTQIGLVPLLIESTRFIDKKIKKKSNNISVDELSHALEITDDSSIR